MNRTLYISTFLLSFLFFLASAIPAEFLLKIVGNQSAVQIAGIQGSIWSGSANQFQLRTIAGKNLRWSVNFLPMLIGKVSLDVTIDDPSKQVQGTVARTLGGAIQFTDLSGTLNLGILASQIPNPLFSQMIHGGKAILAVDEVEIEDGLITYVAGNMQLEKLQLTIPNPVEAGSLDVQLSNNDKGIIANIKDKGDGVLFLQGQGAFLADAQYSLRGMVGARDPKAVELQNWLRVLGRTDAQGHYAMNFTGKL